jgi:hypothetical protein
MCPSLLNFENMRVDTILYYPYNSKEIVCYSKNNMEYRTHCSLSLRVTDPLYIFFPEEALLTIFTRLSFGFGHTTRRLDWKDTRNYFWVIYMPGTKLDSGLREVMVLTAVKLIQHFVRHVKVEAIFNGLRLIFRR